MDTGPLMLKIFVAGNTRLNKAHVQYLEAELIHLAKEARRITLDNGNTPTELLSVNGEQREPKFRHVKLSKVNSCGIVIHLMKSSKV
jgi:hypothetical protein